MTAREIAMPKRICGINVSCQDARKFLAQYPQTHCIDRKPDFGR